MLVQLIWSHHQLTISLIETDPLPSLLQTQSPAARGALRHPVPALVRSGLPGVLHRRVKHNHKGIHQLQSLQSVCHNQKTWRIFGLEILQSMNCWWWIRQNLLAVFVRMSDQYWVDRWNTKHNFLLPGLENHQFINWYSCRQVKGYSVSNLGELSDTLPPHLQVITKSCQILW